MEDAPHVTPDYWQSLQQYTAARIALGSTGASLPTREWLRFRWAHACAKDAVHAPLDTENLAHVLSPLGLPVRQLHSQVCNAQQYLLRPDYGRKLDENSRCLLSTNQQSHDICLVIADGLSSIAIAQHTLPLLESLLPQLAKRQYRLAPLMIVHYGRVAIGDDIGYLMKSKLTVVLIGERPGLSAPDSMGIYLTYDPQPALTDERRNCISNVRPEGLPCLMAAEKLSYLIDESLRRKVSGVALKDDLRLSLTRI